jgi:rubredoxin
MAEVKNTASVSSSTKAGLPRKLTAVGTVGEQNQLFTVYEKNWNCPDCGQENYPARYL